MSDKISYMAVSLYHLFSRMVPYKLWLSLGKGLGHTLYCLDLRHRKIAMTNLRFALGKEKSELELRRIARGHFRQLGITGHEWTTLKELDEKRLEKICELIRVEGEEHLAAAKKKNKAVILLSAHFGNWEYAHLYYGCKINRLNFIVRKMDNDLMESNRLSSNNRYNVNVLYKQNGLRQAIQNLKKGEDLVLFTDRKTSLKEGVPAQFFGQKTSTLTIVATLAKKYNIPVVPMYMVRDTDMLHHRLLFFPELNIIHADNDPDAIEKIVQLQNDALEKVIRMHPDHWLWIHRKWKCYHPHIYK